MWIRLALFSVFALPIALIDIRTGRIPNALSLGAAAAITLYLGIFETSSLIPGLIGSLLCVLFLVIIRAISKGLGGGDVKFSLSIGLVCGPFLSFFALAAASVSALAISLPLLARGKITKKTKLPFGPFLAFGTALVLALEALGALSAFPLP